MASWRNLFTRALVQHQLKVIMLLQSNVVLIQCCASRACGPSACQKNLIRLLKLWVKTKGGCTRFSRNSQAGAVIQRSGFGGTLQMKSQLLLCLKETNKNEDKKKKIPEKCPCSVAHFHLELQAPFFAWF